MNRIYFILVGCLWSVSFFAQNQLIIDDYHNGFRVGDIIYKQQVEFKDPGRAGKNLLWDFSTIKLINKKYQVIYYHDEKQDSNQIIAVREHLTHYYYKLKSDTLWMTEFDNRTTKVSYTHFEALLHFPFKYGDTLSSNFSGAGIYCQKVNFVSSGHSFVRADAFGRLITPEKDTLNVLRVAKIKEFIDIGNDSVKMRMETYQWYSSESRYPVFETVKAFSIKNETEKAEFSTSFYFPTLKDKLAKKHNEKNELEQKNVNKDDLLLNCSVYPNPVESETWVNYQISTNADVSFRLYDASGRQWNIINRKNTQAGTWKEIISMTELPAGNYILSIHINNKVYKQSLIKL